MVNADVWGPRGKSNSWVEIVHINIKGIGKGLYDNVPDICNKDQLEWKVTYSIILKGPENKGLECNNIYGRCWQY